MASSESDIKETKRPIDDSPTDSRLDVSTDVSTKDNFYGSTQDHVFSSPRITAYWQDIYEKAKYEGRHRLDPSFQWSASEEKKLLRKIDFRIMALVWIMYASLDLVRRNINRAVSDRMLPELGMNTNDYNTAQTIYLVTFLAAELPGGLISKKIGADRYTPICLVLWGFLCAVQGAITNKTGVFVLRALLGIAQGGFIPEMQLYLSYWYKSDELAVRLAYFYTGIPVTQVTGALIAAGFMKMRGVAGLSGWRWLFILEGIMSILLGFCVIFLMPISTTETKRLPFQKKGWFSERDEKILVNRILRDDPTKGDMNNRQAVTLKRIWTSLTDVDLLPLFIIGVVAWIPFQPPANYMSLTLVTLNFSVFEANMLAAPGYALFLINVIVLCYFSEKFKERILFASLSNVWNLAFLLALILIPSTSSPWLRYGLLTCVNGMPYAHAIFVGVVSRNSNSVGTRAVSLALYNMTYQIGSIVAVNIYRESDKPNYYRGNRILVGLSAANIVLFVLAKIYYVKRNAWKDKKWSAMSKDEQEHYTATTSDAGLKRLDVRFVH